MNTTLGDDNSFSLQELYRQIEGCSPELVEQTLEIARCVLLSLDDGESPDEVRDAMVAEGIMPQDIAGDFVKYAVVARDASMRVAAGERAVSVFEELGLLCDNCPPYAAVMALRLLPNH